MELYIIRHAQSENNALWARTGSSDGRLSDPDLTEIGHQQAQILAQFLAAAKVEEAPGRWDSHNLAGFDLTHLYSSYMLRAVKTGSYISETISVPLVGWELIHEWGGIYDRDSESGEEIPLAGLDRSYFVENFPDFVLEAYLAEAGWWNFRPFETPSETIARGARFLNELLERHDEEDRVGIVTHGGFADAMFKVLIGHWPVFSRFDENFDPDTVPTELLTNTPDEMWFRLNNASVSRIDIFAERYVVIYWNRVDFLPPELVT